MQNSHLEIMESSLQHGSDSLGIQQFFVLWLLIWIGTCQIMAFLHENDDLPVLNHGLLEDHWFIIDLYWFIEYVPMGMLSHILIQGFRDSPDDQSLDVDYLSGFVAPHFFNPPVVYLVVTNCVMMDWGLLLPVRQPPPTYDRIPRWMV